MVLKIKYHVKPCGNVQPYENFVFGYEITFIDFKIIGKYYTKLAELFNGFFVKIGHYINQTFPIADVTGIARTVDNLLVMGCFIDHRHGKLNSY